MHNKILSGVLLGMLLSGQCFAHSTYVNNQHNKLNVPSTYQNIFLSYLDANNISVMGAYVNQTNLGGAFMWEISGDLPMTNTETAKDDPRSLKFQMNQAPGLADKILGFYWADWDMYSPSRIIPSPASPIESFKSDLSRLAQQHTVRVYYSFLEGISDQYVNGNYKVCNTSKCLSEAGHEDYTDNHVAMQSQQGTLYFNDPWSDLGPQTNQCSDADTTDVYVMQEKNAAGASPANDCSNATDYNNFNLFLTMPNIQHFVSVGGYGHNDSFEVAFKSEGGLNADAENNFSQSVVDLFKNHNALDGIDFDYEDPNMTHGESMAYLALLQKVRSDLNANGFKAKLMTMTILSDPAYLAGKRTCSNGQPVCGFDNLLAFVQPTSNGRGVDNIQLMTYDFHGGFDFASGGTNKTGFLSNLNSDSTYAGKFSMKNTVNEATTLGVPASKLLLGMPAYGRAVANIKPGGLDASGLGQPRQDPTVAIVLPCGDLDDASACTGMFSYHAIEDLLLPSKGPFTAKTDWPEVGATAFAATWSVPVQPNYTLEVKNNSTSLGLTVQVSAGASPLFTSDFIWNKGGQGASDKTYTNKTSPSVQMVQGKTGLTVQWYDFDKVLQPCQDSNKVTQTLDMSQNEVISIDPSSKVCTIMPTASPQTFGGMITDGVNKP